MKILFVTPFYKPVPNFITSSVAEKLAQDHSVTVVTAHPNYPLGKFYPEVDSIMPKCTTESRVKVWRLPVFPSHGKSKIKRLLNYISHLLMFLIWCPIANLRPDLVLVYQTPFTNGLAVLWYKWFLRVPIIHISADLWPESFEASGVKPPSWLLKSMYIFSKWINSTASHIIATSKGMRARYIKDGFPRENISVIPLWTEAAQTGSAAQAAAKGKFTVVYVGNIGVAQKIDTVLQAASLLRDDKEIKFEIYGGGVEEESLRNLVSTLKLTNVHIGGRVSPQEANRICSSASCQIVHLTKSSFYDSIIPSKLSFSLSIGTPILAGIQGEGLEMVREIGAGEPFEPENPISLAASIKRIKGLSENEIQAMRMNSTAYFQKNLSPNRLLEEYSKLIDEAPFSARQSSERNLYG